MTALHITRHKGMTVRFDEDGGYFWENGPDTGGYFDTAEECKADIDDYWASFPDDENIYNLPSIRQSIEEDRRS